MLSIMAGKYHERLDYSHLIKRLILVPILYFANRVIALPCNTTHVNKLVLYRQLRVVALVHLASHGGALVITILVNHLCRTLTTT